MRRVGSYALLSRLTRGDYGELYLATPSEQTNASVVLKLFEAELTADERFASVLLEDLEIASQIEHESLLEILEWGRSGADLFVARPLIRGKSLDEVFVRRGADPVPARLCLHIGAEVASALAAAHRAGTPARPTCLWGLCSSSILVDYDGRVHVLGLGEARAKAGAGARGRRAGFVAPEAKEDGAEPRSDLFSLGRVLLEGLSGRRVERVGAEDLSEIARRLDSELSALLEALCAPEPEDRPDSAELVEQFLRALVGEPRQKMQETLSDLILDRYQDDREVMERLVQHAVDRHQRVASPPRVDRRDPLFAVELPDPDTGSSFGEDGDVTSLDHMAVLETVATQLESASSPSESDIATDPKLGGLVSPRLPEERDTSTLERLGRYEIDSTLSVSRRSTVYSAYDDVASRRVAIKTLAAFSAPDPDAARSRLLREIRIAGRIRHAPGIPTLLDASAGPGRPYAVFELIEGEVLVPSARRRTGGSTDVLDLIRDVVEALLALDNLGIVHGDVRAANIIVSAERAWLVDLASASAPPESEVDGSRPSLPLLAPELQAGASPSARSDQFALGGLLYELLTGSAPSGPSGDRGAIVPPSEIGDVAPVLSEVTMRLLEPDPDRRYSEYREILAALALADNRRSLIPG